MSQTTKQNNKTTLGNKNAAFFNRNYLKLNETTLFKIYN